MPLSVFSFFPTQHSKAQILHQILGERGPVLGHLLAQLRSEFLLAHVRIMTSIQFS